MGKFIVQYSEGRKESFEGSIPLSVRSLSRFFGISPQPIKNAANEAGILHTEQTKYPGASDMNVCKVDDLGKLIDTLASYMRPASKKSSQPIPFFPWIAHAERKEQTIGDEKREEVVIKPNTRIATGVEYVIFERNLGKKQNNTDNQGSQN